MSRPETSQTALQSLLDLQAAEGRCTSYGPTAPQGKRVYDERVDFSLIGLACNGADLFKAERLGDHLIELLDLIVVAVEKRQERGLCAGGAFDASKWQRIEPVLDFLQVHHKLIAPQRRPFADGGQLRRLIMRKTQCRQRAIFFCEFAQQIYYRCQFARDDLQRSRIIIKSALSVISQLVAPR